MDSDELAIRNLLSRWAQASEDEDINKILPLMSEDVIFLRPGTPPMRGREEFAASFKAATQNQHIKAVCDPQEIVIEGDMAYCWAVLNVTVTPKSDGSHMHLSGNTLTVLRKQANSSWVIARDANMLTPQKPGQAG